MKHFCKIRITLMTPVYNVCLLVVIFASTPSAASTEINSLRGEIEGFKRVKESVKIPEYFEGQLIIFSNRGGHSIWSAIPRSQVLYIPEKEEGDRKHSFKNGIEILSDFNGMDPRSKYICIREFVDMHSDFIKISSEQDISREFFAGLNFLFIKEMSGLRRINN